MREYKLNKNKQETATPSDEMINKHKSFGQLRTQYDDVVKQPRLPLYKNKKLFMFLILVALTIWAISESMAEDDKKQKEKDKTEVSE